MRFKNFWLLKHDEKSILKIVQWAQKNGIKVESLSKQDIIQALKEEK